MTLSKFPVSISICGALLAAISGLQACKHAPLSPDFSNTSTISNDQASQEALAELRALEQERADLLAEQQQLEADIATADKGWPEGEEPPVIQEVVQYGSSGKGGYEDITEAKKEINRCGKKGDRLGAKAWFKKLKERSKSKKQNVDQKVATVEVKIGKTKGLVDYSGIVPGPVNEPSGSAVPDFEPPAQDRVPIGGPTQNVPIEPKGQNIQNKSQNSK